MFASSQNKFFRIVFIEPRVVHHYHFRTGTALIGQAS